MPSWVFEIEQKALAKDVHQRYATASEFAQAMECLLLNEEQRKRMRDTGLERYATDFNWGASAAELQRVYRQV